MWWCAGAAGCAWATFPQFKNKFGSFLVLNNPFFIVLFNSLHFAAEISPEGTDTVMKSRLLSATWSIPLVTNIWCQSYFKNKVVVYRLLKITLKYMCICKKVKSCQLKFPCCNQLGETPHFFRSFFNLVPVWFIMKLQLAPSHWTGQWSPTEGNRRQRSLHMMT